MIIKLLEPLNVSEDLINELAQPLKDMGHEFVYYPTKTTDIDELKKRSEHADVIMIANNPYPREVIESNPELKLINVAFTGFDHVQLDNHNIKMCNASGYANTAVAELAIGLVLDVYRRITKGNEELRKPNFSGPFQGAEIKDKVVGIIGAGKIGLETAQLFKAFGATVIADDFMPTEEGKELGITYLPQDEVFKQADIVSLHVPLLPSTKGLVGKEKLEMMKPTAILINCARGPIVDNAALAQALNDGTIAGAGIDVFDMEPPIPQDYPLLQAKNAVLTPHVGFLTNEAMVRRAMIAFDNTIAYLNGNPINIVN
ncbi:2-hydroxyacid dehydrogenase [Jeotgalibaca sp. A127]|uniref:2-hydroxyacid dehydrogenase n=1 Tax=Jeotgalibaca sp. A127 TaxID=3457324 RepID=UPI003FD2C671